MRSADTAPTNGNRGPAVAILDVAVAPATVAVAVPGVADARPASPAPAHPEEPRMDRPAADADPDAPASSPPDGDDEAPAPAPHATGGVRASRAASAATAIFVDSSAIVALVDRDDASHGDVVAAYRNLVSAGYKLFTTNYVIVETFDLLRAGVGPEIARRWLRDHKLAVYHADEQDERKARKLVLDATGGDGPGLSLTDAVSLAVMERLNVADAFAVDPSFLGS